MQPVAQTSPAASVTASPASSSARHASHDRTTGEPPALRPWSRIWRYLAAVGIAMVLWIAVSTDLLPPEEGTLPEEIEARIAGALILDGLLGVVSLCLLPLRRRHPVLTAAVTGLLGAVSASALGAAVVALVSVSTWRRWQWVAPLLAVWVGATICYETVWRPSIVDDVVTAGYAAVSGGFAIGAAATCVATGYYVGARRELLVTLRLRAETAEREQALEAEAAREAERTRIAREMHDVLAHRISLVAMHAGGLAYRSGLTQEETQEAAGVIQRSAHLALSELRQVLGVLRAGEGSSQDGPAEPPQPSLGQVAELIAPAGAHVTGRLDVSGLPGGSLTGAGPLSATVSRTAYRVVQEALTNAYKHAPGSDVVARLAGGPGGLLTIEVHNGPARDRATSRTPGAGLGLLGLTERVELVGGVLEHGAGLDGSFTVRSWLPWEEKP